MQTVAAARVIAVTKKATEIAAEATSGDSGRGTTSIEWLQVHVRIEESRMDHPLGDSISSERKLDMICFTLLPTRAMAKFLLCRVLADHATTESVRMRCRERPWRVFVAAYSLEA